MATQQNVIKYLKTWEEAGDMGAAVEAASQTAAEYDALYDESAMNLLARTPNLLLLLSAFLAGKKLGMEEEAAKHKPKQESLDV